MSTANVRFGNTDRKLLEAYLSLDEIPPAWLTLSELDGFLTALAIGPEVPVNEWMPHVFGGEMPARDDEPAARILVPLLNRWAAIPGEIDSDAFRPILREGEGGSLSGADWADGFVYAMALWTKAWEPLTRDEQSARLFKPIMALGQVGRGEEVSGLLEPAALDLVLAEVAKVISTYVREIAASWRKRRMRPSRSRARLKPNAAALDKPCPCGSGLTYRSCRLCCGQRH